MYYRINVSKNGQHVFATGTTLTSESTAKDVYSRLQTAFTGTEGYRLSVSYEGIQGQDCTDEFVEIDNRSTQNEEN